ncbi:MAG: hypothetical protein ACI9O6_003488 [Glaciecola sp.]|jgi:hypothetical protein
MNDKEHLYRKEIEKLVDAIESELLAPLFLSGTTTDVVLFKRMLQYIYDIAETGTVDQSHCFNLDEMHFFCEAIPALISAIECSPNSGGVSGRFLRILRSCEATALYLELYEDDSLSYPQRSIGDVNAVAAILDVKVSTLKNIESLDKIKRMDKDALRAWLESNKRFKPYKPYSSLYHDTPFDLSFIETPDELMHVLQARCEHMGKSDIFEAFLDKVGLTVDHTGYQKLASINLRGVRKFAPIVEAANVVIDTFLPAYDRACQYMAREVSFQRENIKSFIKSIQKSDQLNHTENSTNRFSADDLQKILIDDYQFEKHPNDRGRNRKMSGLRYKDNAVAIERLKSPQVWVKKNVINYQSLDERIYKIYPASSDGTGRHSGLSLYSDLATDEVIRIKLPNKQAVTDFITLFKV